MKKYLRPQLLPPLTAILGILLLLSRIWLQLGGIDEKGLYISGHTADTISFLLLGIGILGIWLCVRGVSDFAAPKTCFPPSLTGAIGCVAGGAGIVLTGILEKPAQAEIVWLLSLVTGCIACVCLLVIGYGRLKGRKPHYLLHCAVTVYFVVHLVSKYRSWSSEPQLQVFFFPLLAGVLLTLAAYQRTCLDAGQGSRKYYGFFQYAAFLGCLAGAPQDPLFYGCMALWTFTNLCDLSEKKMVLPAAVMQCITMLEQAGFEAFVVGGCVRDDLLGLTPHDYDLCTNAKPEETATVFSAFQLIRNGEKHGTIGVVMNGAVYEITTFRTEGTYSDSRHPDSVEFVSDLKTDLARRDFTVNAMAYNPKTGYVDPFGGGKDLQTKVLKAVGHAETRFREDALRILRGVRFALRFDLTPEDETLKAMQKLAPSMEQLASERIFSELQGILPLLNANALHTYRDIITQVIPELSACVNFNQHTRHHAYDVYTHTAFVTEAADPQLALRFAALLHDIGKPVVFYQDEDGSGHFPEHARVGAEMADAILRRLKAPNPLREQVVFLISHHMTPFEPERTTLRRRLSKYGIENCRLLLQLQKADFCSKGVKGESPDYEAISAMLEDILQEGACLQAKDLAVNGNDLLELGYESGPKLGQTVQALLKLVVDETLPNEKEILLQKAKEMMEESQ